MFAKCWHLNLIANLKINKLKWQKCWVPSEDNDDVVNVDDGDDGVDGTQLTRVSDSDDQCPNTLTRYYKVNMRPRSSNRHHHQLFEGKINTCKFLQIKYFPPDPLAKMDLCFLPPPLSANLHGLWRVMDKTWFNYANYADQDIRGRLSKPPLFYVLRNL